MFLNIYKRVKRKLSTTNEYHNGRSSSVAQARFIQLSNPDGDTRRKPPPLQITVTFSFISIVPCSQKSTVHVAVLNRDERAKSQDDDVSAFQKNQSKRRGLIESIVIPQPQPKPQQQQQQQRRVLFVLDVFIQNVIILSDVPRERTRRRRRRLRGNGAATTGPRQRLQRRPF